MDQSQRKSMSMVIVLVVSAIFCATATFIGITLVANRDRNSAGVQLDLPQQVIVNDLLITLNSDPDKAVFLPGELDSSLGPEAGYPAQENSPDQIPTPGPIQSEDQAPDPAAQQIPDPTPQPDPITTIQYIVQPGDTLYSLAQTQNSSIELMAINGIDSGDIVPGSTLALPIANPAYCPGMRTYIVRENDTVFSLARTFGTTTDDIIRINNLDVNATIYTTGVLCFP